MQKGLSCIEYQHAVCTRPNACVGVQRIWLFKGRFFPCGEAPTKASWPSPMLTIGSWPCWRMTSLQSRTKEPRCRRIGVAVGVLRLYMQGGTPYFAKLANLTPIAGVCCRCIIICLVHKNQLLCVINQPISRRGTTLWVLTMVPTLKLEDNPCNCYIHWPPGTAQQVGVFSWKLMGTLRHPVPQAVHTDPIDPMFQGVPFERPIIGRWGCRPFFSSRSSSKYRKSTWNSVQYDFDEQTRWFVVDAPSRSIENGQLCPVEWFDWLTRPQPATMAEPNVFDSFGHLQTGWPQ